MLQIVSGKFFTSQDRHVHQGKGILYSNYSWVAPIETCVGTLEPVDSFQAVSSYVLSYTNQIEKTHRIIRVGDSEIVEQFQLLTIFGLRAYFAPLRTEVEHLCRQSPSGRTDYLLPAQFVSRFFSPFVRGTSEETERFRKLVDRVIGLKRATYVSVMNALRAVHDALQVIGYNLDLAYSMLIYTLESFAQEFDGSIPQWADYDEEIRSRLDSLFAQVPDAVASSIRNTLIGAKQLRLQKRFVGFVQSCVTESFFLEEAEGIENALRRSELERAIRNAYALRSRYVHMLREIPRQLKVHGIASGDVFHWDGEPYLTLSGLLRLTLHVITSFVWREETVSTEAFDWRGSLPGRIEVRMAPQYWIWQADKFTPKQARQRLSGLLAHLNELRSKGGAITDLRPLAQRIENVFSDANLSQKAAMLATYWLYNATVVPAGSRPYWERFIEDNKQIAETCCIEMMITRLILEGNLPWSPSECLTAYDKHCAHRFGKNSFEIPLALELALLGVLANMAGREGNAKMRAELLHRAILEAGGLPRVQKSFLTAEQDKTVEVDVHGVLHDSVNRAQDESVNGKSQSGQ